MIMMNRIALVAKVVVLVVVGLGRAGAAQAADIKVLCSTALRTVMQELIPEFEHATGNKVIVEYGVSAPLQRRVETGEAIDAIFLTVKQFDALVEANKIAAGTRTVVARSGMAMAIHAGDTKPDVSTLAALKRTLLARSIAYPKEGASGVYFAALAKQLAISDRLKVKVMDSGDAVAEAVASGAAELGILPVSEILPVKGLDLLGEFPNEVQDYVVMVGGVGVNATQPATARSLIAFVTAPAAVPVLKKKGMEPAR
jgi:molybdate transport system substrate-binding protein